VSAAVLFDLDGTLVDHEGAARAAALAWAARESPGHGLDGQALGSEWLRLEDEHYASYLAGTLSFQEQRRARLAGMLAILGCAVPPDIALDRLFEAYLRHYEAAWRAHEDVLPALTGLRAAGLIIGVLTNGQEDQQRAKLQAVGLLDLFTCVVASSTLPSPKPAAAAFVMACERLGRPPAEVFYVGDNLHTDALAASRAGLTGVWINRLGEEALEETTHVVTDLREVLGLVLTRDL